MTPDRWQHIKQVFEAALEHPLADRDGFLDLACTGDPDLRREIDSLLANFEGTGPVDQLAQDFVAPLVATLHPETVEGRRIGPFRVCQQVGQGGMGAVYLAERDDGQFEQRVALKLIRRGMHTDELRHRFLNERRILARLAHPHIARLLDGGLTADEQPYFAMEYVEGESITRYCAREQVSIEDRLRLFATVCEAVRYAHQNLVVHRDLKPSNILVTEGGEVKLLDFGIAKLLEAEDGVEPSSGVVLTRTGMRAMTPEYAAPEQVRGGAITTATDVYALGVLLYELLTGRRPYEVQSLAPSEVERVICETEPVRPSTAVRQQAASARAAVQEAQAESIGPTRNVPLETLERRLAGDLDTMVMKALSKEPARRYASAEALLEDVRRHLGGLPVAAQPDTMGYRLSKFVRRNKVAVAVAVVFLLLLSSFAVAMTVQQARTAQERDRAQLEAAKAAQVSSYLIDLFEVADPGEARGDTVTAHEILARGAARIEEELAAQPEVQGTMLDVMGRVYHKLGSYDKAQTLLERSLSIREATLGAEHPDVGTSMDHLAVVLSEKGAYDEAEPFYRNALAMRRRLLEAPHPDLATSIDNLGMFLHEQGDLEGAKVLYEEALAMRRELFGRSDKSVATSLNNLAYLLHEEGDLDTAAPLYQEALDIDRAVLGADHPDLAIDLNNFASLLYDKGDLDAAESLFRESLAIRKKVFGEEHPSVAISLNNLASIIHEKGDLDAAEPLYREALAIRKKVFKGNHPRVATSLNNVASVLHQKGDFEEAEALYREAWAMRMALFENEEHPGVIINMSNVGRVLLDQGKIEAAEPLLREVLVKRRTIYGEKHPYVALSLNNLAEVFHKKKQVVLAEPLYREALAIWQEVGNPWRIAAAKSDLGASLIDLRQYAQAESLLVDAHAVLTEERGEQSRHTRRTLRHLVDLYTVWDKPDQAASYRARLAEP